MKNKLFLSIVSFALVISIILCLPLSVSAVTSSGDNYHTGIFDRQWLFDYGVLSSIDAQYNLYTPIADTDGVYYYRCDPYNNALTIASQSGSFTVANWGRGTFNSSSLSYSYSKRIGFVATHNNEIYASNEHTIRNFMTVPKNTSVRVSFIVHLTGTVSGWDMSFNENINMSFYSGQSFSVSDKYTEYVTNVENSIWFVGNADPEVGVSDGTPCTRFIVSATITAGNEDVKINSIHFDLNRIKWLGDIGLQYNGTMFMSGLVVDFLKPTTDPTFEKENKTFLERIRDYIADIPNAIGQFFTNLGNSLTNSLTSISDWLSDIWTDLGTWFSNLTSSIGSFFNSLWLNIQDGFNNIVSVIAWPINNLFTPIIDIVNSVVLAFISIVRGVFDIGGGT